MILLFDLWSSSFTWRSALTHRSVLEFLRNNIVRVFILQHPANEANRCAMSINMNGTIKLSENATKTWELHSSLDCATYSRRNFLAIRVLTCGVCPFAFSFLDEAYTLYTHGMLLHHRELCSHQRSQKHEQDWRSQGTLPFSSSAS